MSAGITRDEWLKALAEAGCNVEDDQDSITVTEFTEMFGIQRTAASRRLEQLMAAGRATRTHKWTTATNGRRIHSVSYRLTAAKKTKRSA